MIFQIDTENKTITTSETVKLGEFMEIMERMLPDELWKEFTLIPNTKIEIRTQPIYTPNTDQVFPWLNPNPYPIPDINKIQDPIGNGNVTYGLNEGTYTVNYAG